ncbi:hypothetical protein F5880DRAFT_1457038, partial [Lentinula raphanica]
MVAVELALRTFISAHMNNSHIRVLSDNQGVVATLRKQCSRGREQNLILRTIIGLMQKENIWVDCVWIPTDENIADAPSRGRFP